MTAMLLNGRENLDYGMYCAACRKAIGIHDLEKTLFLLHWAEHCAAQVEPSFFGEMASYAYLDHRSVAREIIHQSTPEQIAAAPSRLLEQFAAESDYRTLSELVEKGISGGPSAARTLHMLTYQGRNGWMAEELLEKRMWVDLDDYNALHACVQNDALDTAKLLLDHGMDFEQYRHWAEHRGGGHEETVQALSDYWQELTAGQEQSEAQEMGGMSLG